MMNIYKKYIIINKLFDLSPQISKFEFIFLLFVIITLTKL